VRPLGFPNDASERLLRPGMAKIGISETSMNPENWQPRNPFSARPTSLDRGLGHYVYRSVAYPKVIRGPEGKERRPVRIITNLIVKN
jgi:hypothetical protein